MIWRRWPQPPCEAAEACSTDRRGYAASVRTYYRKLDFRTTSYAAAVDARERVDRLVGLTVLRAHERKLGFLERERLWGEEYMCRLLVEVRVERQISDPYRMDADASLRTLHDELATLMETLGATDEVVTHAIAFFESVAVEPALIERLVAELTDKSRELKIKAEFSRVLKETLIGDEVALTGRLRGPVHAVNELAKLVQRSHIVPAQAVRVDYG